MSEKRFIIKKGSSGDYDIYDNLKHDYLVGDGSLPVNCYAEDIVDLLNKLQGTIITLKRRLEKINGGYGHLTHRNGLTANEWVIKQQEKELKNKDEMISEFIERHSGDIVQISEQQTTINELKEEMVRLHKMSIELLDRVIPNLRRENGQLRQEIERLKKELDEKCP